MKTLIDLVEAIFITGTIALGVGLYMLWGIEVALVVIGFNLILTAHIAWARTGKGS